MMSHLSTTNYKKRFRFLAVFCAFNLFFNTVLLPTVSYAVTSGPSQPEISSFASIDTSNMVDLFSGDFSYNIPLLELPGPNGGYPFNLVYNSGISPEQEASWVGLGWNLTPGSIQRQMRGIPDEFNGGQDENYKDLVIKKTDMKPDNTYGLTVTYESELFGFDVKKKNKDAKTDSLSFSVPFTLYYNTYKGLGYTLGINPSLSIASQSSKTLDAGLNFSLDSRDGIEVQPHLGLPILGEKINRKFGLSASYSSRAGLMGIGLDYSSNTRSKKNLAHMNGNINLYNQGRVPSIDLPMRTISLTGSVSTGKQFLFYKHFEPKGFFTSQQVDKDEQRIPAHGYMYSQYATAKSIMDINRGNEGPIFKESTSLSTPEATYDIFSVTGHGLQGSFRAYRSDIGIYGNPEVRSKTKGGKVGLDYGEGGAETHVGIDIGFNFGDATSSKWTESNHLKEKYSHEAHNPTNPLYEPFYFKFTNDRSTVQVDELVHIGDSLHGDRTPILKPVRVKLGKKQEEFFKGDGGKQWKVGVPTPPAQLELHTQNEKGTYKAVDVTSGFHPTKQREARNTLVQQFTNAELEHIRLGKVAYTDITGTLTSYDRSNHPQHHIGAFVITKPDGARYIYALPAYNNEHIERQVTVKGKLEGTDAQCGNVIAFDGNYQIDLTDKYSSETKISPYPYAHLLTAIVGDDYVDTDETPGPSDGDIGYWVKFNYKLHTSDYHWRSPFEGVNYAPNFINTATDDKGSYVYGTKEIYYVQSAETKSHIVKFQTSERLDGIGAYEDEQNIGASEITRLGKKQLKLDQISLYVKSALTANPSVAPLKTVKLTHDDQLCKGVINSPNRAGGKLTLKKVEFLYQNSMRGSYNAYAFHYSDKNPSYNSEAVDRWGSYTSIYEDNACKSQYFPYVDQRLDYEDNAPFPSEYYLPQAVDRQKDASAWLLSAIDLPSGATIQVDYESDDYAYVQNKVAMQMMNIDAVGNETDFQNRHNKLSKDDHKVFFRLERPIPKLDGSATAAQRAEFEKNEVNKYLDGTGQVYFKTKISLQKEENGIYDFVTGYADVVDGERGLVSMDAMNLSNYYTHGYITLKPISKGSDDFHPFSVAAWQHIKTKQPKLLMPNASGFGDDGNDFLRQLATIASVIPEMKRMFQGFYDFMYNRSWGRVMDLDNSWIRLNSPDRIKYGGGVRVKRIVLNDKWEKTGGASFYGQQYDYRIEENGQLISSGVAAYEPQIGGDENALRWGEATHQKLKLATDNHYFLEHPINEGLYPSPQVGYRKVTVKSLAAANLAGEEVGTEVNNYFVDAGFHATTGVTVHEFYTAKEFPVIVDRTTIDRRIFNFWIPIYIGDITLGGLTASQGFSIETNDMHGKPKQVTHYRQKPDGSLLENPVSWTKYNYKKVERGTIHKGGEKAFGVDNRVEVLLKDDGTKEGIEKEYRLVGLEREFVVDMQEQVQRNGNVEGDINLDLKGKPFVVFLPSGAPKVGGSFYATRMVTTNKIVSRSGILESVEAYDGTATLKTENLLWDAQTAEVLLTSVNNSFEDKIYNYSIPARFHYEKTKAAYHNADFTLALVESTNFILQTAIGNTNNYMLTSTNPNFKYLVEGDEVVLTLKKHMSSYPEVTRYATFIGKKEANKYEFFIREHPVHTDVSVYDRATLKVIRSGNKNLLGAKVGAITALVDPTDPTNRTKTECEKELIFPSDCDTDATGLSDLSINWTATSNITVENNSSTEIEVLPAGGTETFTYLWNIYDANNAIVRTLQSYTRRIPISNDPNNLLSGNYTIKCTIIDTQNRITTSIPRTIIFN